jgi:NAD-dependent dihydropyrimidine dehydrogenase PreA subunit
MPPRIVPEKCRGCNDCVTVCPNKIICVANGKAKITDPEACIECANCIDNCGCGGITGAKERHEGYLKIVQIASRRMSLVKKE